VKALTYRVDMTPQSDRASRAFSHLSTPLLADAHLRCKVDLRPAPPGIGSLSPELRVTGRALPARHYGSVDIFLEAIHASDPGDVLVIDNGGRPDEGCIGDLVCLEAQAAGLAGIVVWGVHRDTSELKEIGLPVFSYGRFARGPVRLGPREPDALSSARFGSTFVTNDDVVFGDEDGVLFFSSGHAHEIFTAAHQIWEVERGQALKIRSGESLRQQTAFDRYLAQREGDPTYTFRQHLRTVGGAIEE
jgi:regulator of RNase E activity RraA